MNIEFDRKGVNLRRVCVNISIAYKISGRKGIRRPCEREKKRIGSSTVTICKSK